MHPAAKYHACSMKSALALICVAFCCAAVRAQAPDTNPTQQAPSPSLPLQNPTAPQGPVPITEEPHHRLVLQNDFTHVYNVTVPPLDTTLLHQHDLPYLFVVLGPADINNNITGKGELHQVLADGEVHYSPGHFSHIVRTDSGMAFHNVTVELVRPQGTPKNLCKDVLQGAPLNCPDPAPAPASPATKGKKAAPKVSQQDRDDVPYFETDEIRVDLHRVSSGDDYVDATPKTDALLIGLTNANLDANLGGEHIQFLHGGDVMWLPAGQRRRIVDFLGTHSGFLLVSFKDGTERPATQ
jgi:hypothetical protein